jgi:hypothetical protein
MSILLDENQSRQVASGRKDPGARPKFYNAALSKTQIISEDFEAFLVLLGRPRTKAAMQWLKESSDYQIIDADRDSLLNKLCDNEIEDAKAAQKEVSPIIDRFRRFRADFLLTGFEAVPEVGMFLEDLQRPMAVLQNLSNRLQHRLQSGVFVQGRLQDEGMTPERQKQIDSWYGSLTAY